MPFPSPPRRRIVGVSTKMYFSAARTRQYVNELLAITASHADEYRAIAESVDVFIIPDHLTLASVVQQLDTSPLPKILPGAQDTFYEDAGAYTGEVSPSVLAEIGCRIVELGHAERRRIFGETDDDAARKAAAAARNGMIPLVCIGERTKPAEPPAAVAAAAQECRSQVESVMAAVPRDAPVVLAYEPVWAIGAAEPASAAHVVGVTRHIRQFECLRARPEGSTRILYGGSAGPGLFAKLAASETDGGGVDGLFLGRFAHDPQQFWKTIQEIAAA
ncbi:triosephosphate isomerase [Microdochium bolleyi]|uniref:Triosephosphate isomerase n=1 Tax=Microdochium bolleyi TaxID=196109 RepID=A0A136JCU7_9PEZI|nr:triosephosphate isomerase [Microdochium bolleyi]